MAFQDSAFQSTAFQLKTTGTPALDTLDVIHGPGNGKRREKAVREYDKDSYMARLFGRPIDFAAEPEVIEVIEQAAQSPIEIPAEADAQEVLRLLGIQSEFELAYAQAYATLYRELVTRRQQEDEAIAQVVALLL